MNFRILIFTLLFIILSCFYKCAPTYYLLTDNINSLKNKDIKVVKIDTLRFSDHEVMFKVWFR
jgi:hypothetical protein